MALVTTYHNSLLRAMSPGVAPYFRAFLFTLRPVETDTVPTAAIDKNLRVYWNRAFFAGLSINEGAFVVLHEMMHAFLYHASRAKAHGVTDFKLWNTACDCEINRTLSHMQGVTVPEGGCLPEKFDLPTDGRAEQYYDALRMAQEPETEEEEEEEEEPTDGDTDGDKDGDGQEGDTGADDGTPGDKPGKGPGTKSDEPGDTHGSGSGDEPGEWELPLDDEDSPGVSNVDQRRAAEKAAQDIKDADAKHPGSVPGKLVREATAMLAPPKVPWQRVLQAAVNHGANAVTGYDEPTYRRIAARSFSLGSGVLLPTYESYQPNVSIVIDTSGSMSQADLDTALRETQGVCKALDCAVTVFAVDTQASAAQVVTDIRDIKLSGGGGTDMSEGIRIAMDIKPRPHIVVVLTDGYTGWPHENPNRRIKCIVVVTERGINDLSGIPSWITAIKVS